MRHNNYHEIEAETYYELGIKKGELFGEKLRRRLAREKKKSFWRRYQAEADKYLKVTERFFPDLIAEMKGYATAADIEFRDLWLISLEEEFKQADRCTTVITNQGNLIAHNEDWELGSRYNISVLKKTLPDLTVFELNYFYTLGGNSISINSHGYVQAINTLRHSLRTRAGIPRNFLARWLSETKNPGQDLIKIRGMPLTTGYSHNIVGPSGKIWNLEHTAQHHIVNEVKSPYVHTNHILSELKEHEANKDLSGSFRRLEYAQKHLKANMAVPEVKKIMSQKSEELDKSILNRKTIARMIIDRDQKNAQVWLLREKSKGWLSYDISSIL